MKLNMYILLEDLGRYDPQSHFSSVSEELTLSFPVVYNGEFTMEPDRLYVARAEQLPSSFTINGSANILCIGAPAISFQDGLNIIWIPYSNISLFSLFSYIAETFNRYQVWDESLRPTVDSADDLDDLGRKAEEMLGNPVNLIDCHYRWIFFSTNKHFLLPADYGSRERKEHIPFSLLDALNDQKQIELHDLREPYIMDGPFEYESLCINIFEDDEYFATLYIDNIMKPFSSRDRVLIRYLANILQTTIKLKYSDKALNSTQRIK